MGLQHGLNARGGLHGGVCSPVVGVFLWTFHFSNGLPNNDYVSGRRQKFAREPTYMLDDSLVSTSLCGMFEFFRDPVPLISV